MKLSPELRKTLIYYFLYCCSFIFIHISLVSVFTFFHFLLDHQMNTIENWLNRNSWEIILISKGLSFFLVTKIFQLNSYQEIHPLKKLFEKLTFPSKKIFGMSFFILGMIYIYISQFGGGRLSGQFNEGVFYSSFIGSVFYYLLDFLVIVILTQYYTLKDDDYNKVAYTASFLFILTSKIVLPYMSKYYSFILIHFLTLFFLNRKGSLIDCFIYSIFVIGVLSSIYGLDLVWDNSYAIFYISKSISIIGLVGIWSLALGYYRFSRLK